MAERGIELRGTPFEIGEFGPNEEFGEFGPVGFVTRSRLIGGSGMLGAEGKWYAFDEGV